MKLKDIIKLPELLGFRLAAGSGGLDKEVNATEIIDFEFADGITFTREEMFYGNSLGITSLMFARHDPSLILGAVKQLDAMGVACLCYKPIFFKKLPEEVLEYSEKNSFPIFEITDDAFFEDIVLAVKKEAGLDMTEKEIEEALEKVMGDRIGDSEAERLAHMVLPSKGTYLQAACFEGSSGDFDRDHMVRYIRRLSLDPKYSQRVSLTRFRQGGLVLLTRETASGGDMDVLFKDAAIASGLPVEKAVTGLSSLHERKDFGEAIREAFWALQAAHIAGADLQKYDSMGVYKMLAPEMSGGRLTESAKAFLAPLFGDGEDLLNLVITAKEYVLSGCDLNIAADKLFCHKNTVRYRLKRIQELLGPDLDEEDFTESLILAVRVLLLEGALRRIG